MVVPGDEDGISGAEAGVAGVEGGLQGEVQGVHAQGAGASGGEDHRMCLVLAGLDESDDVLGGLCAHERHAGLGGALPLMSWEARVRMGLPAACRCVCVSRPVGTVRVRAASGCPGSMG